MAERGGHPYDAALAYRQLPWLAPTTGYGEAASDRLGVLVSGGTPLPPLSMAERIDRAERLLRGGVPKTAGDEAERIADERSEEHTSELQSPSNPVCRLLLEKKSAMSILQFRFFRCELSPNILLRT